MCFHSCVTFVRYSNIKKKKRKKENYVCVLDFNYEYFRHFTFLFFFIFLDEQNVRYTPKIYIHKKKKIIKEEHDVSHTENEINSVHRWVQQLPFGSQQCGPQINIKGVKKKKTRRKD